MQGSTRLERFQNNVQNNYPNLPVQYANCHSGFVAIRLPKRDGFERNRRILSGLIGGHGLKVKKVADGAGWNEYWVTSVHDSYMPKHKIDGTFWRYPNR